MSRCVLETDGYKFSMAEAGWPLRRETFYYTHRVGGPQRVPVDVAKYVEELLPVATHDDYRYLVHHGYEMGAGFKAAICQREKLRVDALPMGATFYPGEPVFTVSGPSALVSWLEPLLVQLHFRIQLASIPEAEIPRALARLSCARQKEIALETLAWRKVPAPPMAIDEDGYRARVREVASQLTRAVGGDPSRLFEVGLRAACCTEEHFIALQGCKQAGLTRTSNVLGARELEMIPVGTMGHEHVQRYGSDEAAFRAMRERRPERSSYLLDTFDTLELGLPAAFALILEEPERGDSVRFDSGDKAEQFRFAVHRARELGIEPVYILEDGLDVAGTERLEAIREELGVAPDRVFYGYGGQLISRPAFTFLSRDRVSAIWKLCESGGAPTMKFGNAAAEGKQSLPGRPVVWRRVSGSGPVGIVGQDEEPVAPGYVRLTGAERDLAEGQRTDARVELSLATRALVEAVHARHFPPRRPPAHPHFD